MPAVLLFVYIAVPVLEIATLVWMVGLVGGWWTLGALLGSAALGAALVSRSGRSAMTALREAAVQRRPPDRRLADSGLTFVAGLLLLVPGLWTSTVGLVLALPLTRPLTRRWLLWSLRRRAARYAEALRAAQRGPGGTGGTGTVVHGDVLDAHDTRTTGLPPDGGGTH